MAGTEMTPTPGELTLDYIHINEPTDEDKTTQNGRRLVNLWRGNRVVPDVNLPESSMPENIKNFTSIYLSYFSRPILNFLQEFQQNSLLEMVNLGLSKWTDGIPWRVLNHLLPLISTVNSIRNGDVLLYEKYKDECTKKKYSQMVATILAQTRILEISASFLDMQMQEDAIDRWCKWLYTPRTNGRDGEPRVLIFTSTVFLYSEHIYPFIDRLEQDFLMADCPICFFIRIWVTDHDEVQWQRDISLKNAKTHERLVIKKVAHNPIRVFNERLRLISRYPLGAAKQWVEANEEAVLDWKFWDQCRQISLGSHIKNTIRKKRKNNKKSTKNDMHILNNV